jgi:2,4-dienoyl-CoA reductase-like NADH-dependent reductase (Old Yellow Enzyme family)
VSRLFSPITLRDLTMSNRVWVAPMCQYSAVDGVPNDWHLVHLGSLARGGAGLILTEASAVVPEGRISPQDTGLWNDEQQQAWAGIVDLVHAQGAAIGVQLAHAGRKASTERPWEGRGGVADADGGWEPVGPAASSYPGLREPRSLITAEIAEIVTAFGRSAERAVAAGFDTVEVHAAHGYLLHQFLSPLSNDRDDEYGGSFEHRTRLVREVVDEVRRVLPTGMPLLVRISATDWVEGGWTPEESVELSRLLAAAGADLIDVSTGGNAPAEIPVGPGYQVPFARQIREGAAVPTGAVGLITEPAQAEQVLLDGDADVVLLARALLRNPHWPLAAAHELGAEIAWPDQYARAALR